MNKFSRLSKFLTLSLSISLLAGQSAMADITILQDWTQIQDPAHPGFTGTTPTSTTAILFAGNQPVPAATDIGYQSFDGSTAASSTTGFAFKPDSDFSVAIDYNLSFANSPTGGLGLGFGVGESSDGANSAGGSLLSVNGDAFAIGTFARINDINQVPSASAPIIGLIGSINVAYTASSGDITIGFAPVGTEASVFSGTFSGIQNSWNDESLLVSFFLRSDDAAGLAWTSGDAQATFSNMRVVSGAPVAVPEPETYSLILLLASGAFVMLRRRS